MCAAQTRCGPRATDIMRTEPPTAQGFTSGAHRHEPRAGAAPRLRREVGTAGVVVEQLRRGKAAAPPPQGCRAAAATAEPLRGPESEASTARRAQANRKSACSPARRAICLLVRPHASPLARTPRRTLRPLAPTICASAAEAARAHRQPPGQAKQKARRGVGARWSERWIRG